MAVTVVEVGEFISVSYPVISKIDLRIPWKFSKREYQIVCWTPNFWVSCGYGFLQSGRWGMFLLPLSRMEDDKTTAGLDSFLFRLSVQNLLFNHWPRREEGLWCYSNQGNKVETLFYSKQGKFPKNRAGLTVFTGSQNLTHIQWDCWVCHVFANLSPLFFFICIRIRI